MMLCSFMILTVPSIIAAQPAFSRGERQRGLGARSVISGGDTLYPAVAGGDTRGFPGSICVQQQNTNVLHCSEGGFSSNLRLFIFIYRYLYLFY